jgi:hypothetical protein
MQAVGLLRDAGYERVGHYPGGMQEWMASGEPVESGPVDGEGAPAAATPRRALRRRIAFARGVRPVAWIERLAEQSYSRLLGMWFVMVFGLGVFYWLAGRWGMASLREAGAPLATDWHGLATAIYFSFVTATSVGFGDVVPVGGVRAVAVFEGAAGLLIFGCVVSKLVSQRQEMLVEETHRIAFEDRLDRVRTNLHLVLSDLQSIASDCAAPGTARERSLARLESTTMVFAGELRSIHDLLYRPRVVPEEAALEGLLTGLAGNLRELTDLLALVPDTRARLAPTLQSIRRLAGEICGECVPRQYAPELKSWMDRIQASARELTAAP